ncbi:MAG: hypothetical protein NZ889_02830 [Candidatus Pacearchaeota archaeon]|nr:hypothetical protein [Candidatus Pacearchaeota archaeon]
MYYYLESCEETRETQHFINCYNPFFGISNKLLEEYREYVKNLVEDNTTTKDITKMIQANLLRSSSKQK